MWGCCYSIRGRLEPGGLAIHEVAGTGCGSYLTIGKPCIQASWAMAWASVGVTLIWRSFTVNGTDENKCHHAGDGLQGLDRHDDGTYWGVCVHSMSEGGDDFTGCIVPLQKADEQNGVPVSTTPARAHCAYLCGGRAEGYCWAPWNYCFEVNWEAY